MGIYTERVKSNLDRCDGLLESCLRVMDKRAVKPEELYKQLQLIQKIVNDTRQLVDNDRG